MSVDHAQFASERHPTAMSFFIDRRHVAAVLAFGALGGCATARITQREDHLSAAGFVVRPADTPARVEMLQRLPAQHFVRREKDGKVSYIFADPKVCGCLYVGSEQAYNEYKRDRMQEKLADEQAFAAQEYNDARWNWNTWGAWDPSYGLYYGPGVIGW